MNRWLEKIQKAPSPTPRKPPRSPLRGLGGEGEAPFPENHTALEAPDTHAALPCDTTPSPSHDAVADGTVRLDWLEWIASEVPLVPGDREYVWARLATLPPQAVERVARRYVETWQTTADRALADMSPENRGWWAACEEKDAPWPIGPTNRGRDAANRTLLALVEPGSWRHRHTHRKP